MCLGGCASAPPAGDAASPGSSTAISTPAPAGGPDSAPDPEISSELAVATLDAAWRRIHETDFDPAHGGVDWIAVREEFRPQAAAATSNRELRRVLTEMIARLDRSHFGIIPGELADREAPVRRQRSRSSADARPPHRDDDPSEPRDAEADDHEPLSDGTQDEELGAEEDESDDPFLSFGLSLRIVEGRPVVAAVDRDSPAAKAGVRPGWVLLEIDGTDPEPLIEAARETGSAHARYAAEAFVSSLDFGPSRRGVPLVFLDLEEQERRLSLRREPSRAEIVKVGNLPAMPSISEWRWLSEEELDRAGATGRRIGLIRFTVWMPAAIEGIDSAIDGLRDAEGIILDLRGNPGGFAGMVMGIGGHFVDEPVSIGRMITRETSLEFRLNPRRATQDGRLVQPILAPLAILIDPLSASTSEVFAGGLQDIGRARIFGETSAGAVLPAQLHRLPNGDLLLHAFADFRVPSGSQLEGTGVVPDVPVTLTRDQIAAVGDPVLIEAVRWIRDAPRAVR